MASRIIKPAKSISGEFRPPPDKSITHRALMISALSDGVSRIKNPLRAEDCLSTAKCLKALGVDIKDGIKDENGSSAFIVKGSGLNALTSPCVGLDCGNSGTTMRLLSGILAGQNFKTVLSGDESLSRRPMKRIIEPLTLMGAEISANDGNFPPLEIIGKRPLKPLSDYRMPVSSAQVKSCILLAALYAGDGKTKITETVKSRDHTERMLYAAGVKIIESGMSIEIFPTNRLDPLDWLVPGDFSSAAFFLVCALCVPGAKLSLTGIGINPTRTGLLEVLKNMGARITIEVTSEAGGEPQADLHCEYSELSAGSGVLAIGPEMIPSLIDEIPVLAVIATQVKGETRISGAEELRVKESDRLDAVTKELSKMGAVIRQEKDGLCIQGPAKLSGAVVDSHNDHRIAMALAMAGLIAGGETTILRPECVDISFPGFWESLQQVVRFS